MAIKLIPGIGHVDESRAVQAVIPGIGSFDDPGVTAPSATSLSMTGPVVAEVGEASSSYVVSVNGTPSGSVVVTPNDGGQSGTFTPTSVTLSASVLSASFTYTPLTSGTKTISVTNDGGLDNPSPIVVECTAEPVVTIDTVTVSGQRVTITGTFSESPNSGLATLTASATPNGAVTQGPKAVTLVPSEGTYSVFFDAPPGNYDLQSVTMSNSAGSTTVTASYSIAIIPITGNPEAAAAATNYTVSGPTSGNVGAAAAFSSTANGETTANVTVSDGGAGGTFSPSATFAADGGTFSYTPVSTGTKTLSFTNNGGLTNQANISYSVSPVADTQDPVMFGSITVSNVTDVSMTLAWQAGSDNVGVTAYEYSMDSGANWTVVGNNVLSVNVVGLTPATTYNIRARAKDAAGRYSNILSTSQATNPAATVPGAPTNVSVLIGFSNVTISFLTPVSNGGSPITSYKAIASTGQEQTGSSSPIVMSVPSDVDITVTVVAINSVGPSAPSAPSASFRVNTPLPDVTVQVIPGTTMVVGGASQQFTAIVSQPNASPSQSVTYVTSAGTISTTGLFTAPPATFFAQTITITVISAVNPSKFDTATVVVPAVVEDEENPATTVPVRHYSGSILNRYGVAVEDALVTVTNSDTGEKAELFSDKALTNKIFNPILTNELGLFEFYVLAVQCSYSVRGKGIEPYVRSDIFDIINNVDLTPLTNAIGVLESTKVSHDALDSVISDLATKSATDAIAVDLENTQQDLAATAQSLDSFETTTANALSALGARASALEAANAANLAVVDVHRFVTSGSGTLAAPWIGWDTAVTWADNTQYDFRDGVYGYVNSPNFGKNFLRINGRENTRFKHTGTGNALIIDAGPNSGDTVVGVNIRVKLESNASASGGVYSRGIAQSRIDLEFNNVPGVCFTEVSCLMNRYRLVTSPVKRTRTITPVALLSTTKRATGYANGGSKYDLLSENCSDIGIYLTEISNSEFSGVSQFNNSGLVIASSVRGCKFDSMAVINNVTEDITVDCENSMFLNMRGGNTTIYRGKGNIVFGGTYDTLKIGGSNHVIGPLVCAVNGGRFEHGAINTAIRDVFNATTQRYELEQGRDVKALTVRGRTSLSSETFSVGESEIYKTPNGQLCFGTSQPTGVARLTMYNVNNTATDINFQSLLQSFSTTAYHYKANSGGATDVMFISGNGNVTNLNNSYGAISDARLKTVLGEATPKLEDLMNVRVVNYTHNSDPTEEKLLGVVAQELEQVFPGMVHTDENGFKSVKYSVFVPMLVKAIQELNEKIDAK